MPPDYPGGSTENSEQTIFQNPIAVAQQLVNGARQHGAILHLSHLTWKNGKEMVCAGEAGCHAGESPAGRIGLFTTES